LANIQFIFSLLVVTVLRLREVKMAHYAYIDENNLVTNVIVGRDENDLEENITSWADYFATQSGQRVIQTSYNTYGGVHYTDGEPSANQSKALRGNYAGIGYTYDDALDAFIPPKPFESWQLDEDTYNWVAPIPMPEDGFDYVWDESEGDWVAIPS
jgi:hypothetical protein